MSMSLLEERQTDWCGLSKWDSESDSNTPVPLVSVDVSASLIHAVAQVEVTQVFVNKEEQPIEAVYYFPGNPDGAVTHFQAEVEGKVIKAEIKPSEEARKVYDKAFKDQKTAFFGEETKPDIFQIRVGFLKPGSQAKVVIGYVTEVKNEPGSDTMRFYIPTTIAPRYVSPSETDDNARNIADMKYSDESPAPLSLKVAVSLQGGIKSVESPTHNVRVTREGPVPQNEVWHKAIVELIGDMTDMDRDFVLNVSSGEPHKPRLYSEKSTDNSTAVMLHFVPSFKLDEQKAELIFVLDRSGSMEGQSIQLAKQALLLFLHSMPADCYFNIVGFGDTHEFLFEKSKRYDDANSKKAFEHSEELDADLGGTEILKPLQKIYAKSGVDGYLRQIFLLTDGQVSDSDSVIGIAQANAHKARVFTLGIGAAVSHHLVEGVAKAGGGTSAFVSYNESIEKKVLNQLKNALQPSLTEIELEWEGVDSSPIPIIKEKKPVLIKMKSLLGYNKPVEEEEAVGNMQSPKRIPPIFDGSQMVVFGLFKGCSPKSVTVKAQSPDGPLTLKIENSENDLGNMDMLHRLAAVKLVRELEVQVSALACEFSDSDFPKKEKKLRTEIERIACQNGIASRYTSFVAVDTTDNKPSKSSWVMATRNVPLGRVETKSKVYMPKRHLRFFRRLSNFSSPPQVKCAALSQDISTDRCASGGQARQLGHRSYSLGGNDLDEFSDADLVQAWEEKKLERTEPSQNTSPLLQLVKLQSFDGHFALDGKLAVILGKSVDQLRSVAAKHNRPVEVFATAVAVAYFVTKLEDQKDIWELVVMKAKKWLAKAQSREVDQVILEATNFLKLDGLRCSVLQEMKHILASKGFASD